MKKFEPIFHIQPPPQEIFQDQQECTQSIQQFALNRGYLIKIRNSCPTNTFYRCSRGGSASQNEHKDRKSKNPATSQLIGCPFEAKLIFQPASNNWLFTCTNPAHNHPEENNIDTSSQPLTLEIKEEIKELLRNGMKPKKIGEELQPEYPNHQITAARIYELGKQIKNQKTPENSLVQQLRESLAESSFFNETKYNKDGDINSIFFYHPLSFKLLSNYPKIIFVDSPANQNKYQMHLIHIAGLGGNNEQFSIAFSFISTRSIYSYSWTLQQFQSLFVDYHIPLPEIFTTLPDRHLQRSITKLFPKSQILLSTSHIEKDVRAKAKNYIQDIRDQGGAVTQWSSLIKKLTHTSFQQAFDHFKSQYPSHFIQSVIGSWIPLSSLFLYHFTKDITHFNHTNLKLHLSHRYIDSLLLGTNPCPSVMLQSLSDSLKVKAQAILDNFDPEKLTKINSFFNNCLGKISNFALQKAQHNFTQTRESSPPTTCTNSHTTRTGIPCKHRILELLELGLLAQPEHFDPQWHLRHQGGLVGGLNSTEGGVGRRCGQSRNFLERRHPKKTPGTERRHPKHDWERRHPKETPGTERRHPNFVAEGDWERRHPKKTPGTERRHPKHDGERRHPKETPGTERRHHPNFVAEGDWERRHPKKTPGTERRQTNPPQLSLTQQSEDFVVISFSSLIPISLS
ncbi:hypothetical protein PSTT_16785 [Puccinia striiformis]|uniref:MULE transposase domain-containing protein n=1 Tax=Puccinia striiformis TaxID=27350 RepID=A0A2S4UB93_9BASI|nr:hypothetical protein PSTT_16785 [Puccinia striiformis]